MEFERKSTYKRKLNLTPLIDVIFLLVIFFMLTSKFVVSNSVDLGISTVQENDKISQDKSAIVVVLSPNGKFMMNGEKHSLERLESSVRNLIKYNKNKDITIISTKGVTVQDMVKAMDKIKKAGGKNISFADVG